MLWYTPFVRCAVAHGAPFTSVSGRCVLLLIIYIYRCGVEGRRWPKGVFIIMGCGTGVLLHPLRAMRMLSWLPLLPLAAAPPPSSPADPWALFKYECPASPSPPPPPTAPPLVSFEEWKRIQIAQPANDSSPPLPPADSPSPGPHTTATPAPAQQTSPPPPPRKYNYASPDCSARIHSSSPLTQHAPSLLHKSRDRYMLTPCRASEHWVVVELCDEIRIEAIEIAVWEFFSGVVRQVQVSVGGEDEGGGDVGGDVGEDVAGRGHGWKQVGSFIGKNVRGPQTFTLPQPTAFHRFIRLDFSSYYGSEYYCPVSSLKVYGMNQMEAFKWEQKQLNHNREKELFQQEEEDVRRAKETQERDRKERERDERDKQQQREKELDELEKLLHEQAGRLVPSEPLTDGLFSTDAPSPAPSTGDDEKRDDSSLPTNGSLAAATSTESSTTPSPYTRAVPRSDSSESIYAFIIRRLNALEGNSSLVARYMEEQAKVMRSMLKRVEVGWDEWKGEWEDEDRGRWQQEVCPSFSLFSFPS